MGKAAGAGVSLPHLTATFLSGSTTTVSGFFLNKWRRPDWRWGQQLPENRQCMVAGSVSLLYVHACTLTPHTWVHTCTRGHSK